MNYSPDIMNFPLSEEEFAELDDFLESDAVGDETMPLDALDGFLTAIAIGPVEIAVEEWMPLVWGPSGVMPTFGSVEEMQRIVNLILRQMNGIVVELEDDADTFEPVLDAYSYGDDPREYLDGELWAVGFMQGVELRKSEWQAAFDDPATAAALEPLYLLCEEATDEDEEEPSDSPELREQLSEQIAGSVATLYRYWLPKRQAALGSATAAPYKRDQAKIGRNDLCPCGSGKKFKKCCGLGVGAIASATLH